MAATTVEAVRYVFDENLLRVGRALSALRTDFACVGQAPIDDLLPASIGDTDWISLVAMRGWVMITHDKRLRTRPAEARLALDSGLKVVHLHRAGQMTSWDQAIRLMSRWPNIDRFQADRPDGPWWLSVRLSSTHALDFQPGQVEKS